MFDVITLFRWQDLRGKQLKIAVSEDPEERTVIVSGLDEAENKIYVLEMFQDGRHIGGAGVTVDGISGKDV